MDDGSHMYMCLVCGLIYNEHAGLPDSGISPDTPWDAVSSAWFCPECEAGKCEFEHVEED